MIIQDRKSLFAILENSPFFYELSFIEREVLLMHMIETHPDICMDREINSVGYETSWTHMREH
ncbi:MAG: hypothetical protein ISR96_08745 [Nitrospira sp.]|nr:hypothetical protein [bacterium]MBL7049587.1 hypothetical protein [Nitrospira sp.]